MLFALADEEAGPHISRDEERGRRHYGGGQEGDVRPGEGNLNYLAIVTISAGIKTETVYMKK